MMTKVATVGVISKQDYIKRTIAIAKGAYAPAHDEPKIWFESMQTLSQVLSSENQKLLELILNNKPASLTELGKLSDRKPSNLSRTLKTLERYGIVALPKIKGRLVPEVKVTDFDIKVGLNFSKPVSSTLALAAS